MGREIKWILSLPVFICSIYLCHAEFDPYNPGPHKVTNFTLDRTFVIGLPENIEVWAPQEAGNYPLIYFLGGLDMIIPADQYSEVSTLLASHGYIMVVMWRTLSPVNPLEKLVLFNETVEWCSEHLENNMHNHEVPQDVHIDFANTLGLSHSAGSHTIVDYLKRHCKDFKALAMLSPVDGTDPLGINGPFAITPGEYLNFDIPTYILAAGLDSVPAPGIVISCSPEVLGSGRFWAALRPESRKWFVNSTEYGHNDFMDHFLSEDIHPCSTYGGTHDEYVFYRHFVAGQIVSFYKAVLEDDCAQYLPFIQDTENMPITTTGTYDDVPGCPEAMCQWTAPPSTTAPATDSVLRYL